MDPEGPRLALHPQRKRKFFLELAELLGEEPREIRQIQDAFFGPELPDSAAQSNGDGFEVEGEQAVTGDKSAELSSTTLVNSGLVSENALAVVRLELADYYDDDRMRWMNSLGGMSSKDCSAGVYKLVNLLGECSQQCGKVMF
ncbi:hypothetical protein BBJ29_002003 [Phytophthora kernoviae]|uniref:Uncharacterized protein n=1 Tax=Phytophthora kernoviae TaxID=325452 RepID=A0A3F2S4A1_9STRA|nr:hypothetical protein BBJ29_002003 [Phytophthora kernoviae]RLN69895.1 hypothetical protein BBP00_00000022 [Phytophthora kernoviae]